MTATDEVLPGVPAADARTDGPVTTTTRGAAVRDPLAAALDPAFDAVRDAVLDRHLHAAVMAVATREGVVRSQAFTRPGGDQVTPWHVFFLASVTKPIVATGVMQLVGQGALDLHEPIRRHIPEFAPPGGEAVTPWHLLTHTSGTEDLLPIVVGSRPSAATMLELVCRRALKFEPGTRFEYTSASFYLLAELITRLSGMPYPVYLRHRIFDPLGMVDTTFDPRHARRRLTPVHGVGLDNRIKKEFALRYLASVAIPGGGLWSTAPDLVVFGQALLNGGRHGDYELLPSELVDVMTSEHTSGIPALDAGAPEAVPYGLGWGKPGWDAISVASPRAFHHGGASGTRLWIDPELGFVFVFLTNEWSADNTAMLTALRGVYDAFERSPLGPQGSGD